MNWNPRLVKINNLQEAKAELTKIGADEHGIQLMMGKAVFYAIHLDNVPGKAASIIKQELLSKGGEAAIARQALVQPHDPSSVLMLATAKQYQRLVVKLKMQQFGLPKLASQMTEMLKNLQGYQPYELQSGNFSLPLGNRTLVMGILNITPDSFSDGGKYIDLDLAVEHAKQMVADGADLIDVGGESTRPGAVAVSTEEELRRVIPVLERLSRELAVPMSIDTYKAEVASKAVASGASLVNDIWGLRGDPAMARTVAALDVPYIMMHNQADTNYQNLMGDIIAFFRTGMEMATAAGMRPEQIILDPGIGFGKTYEQNLAVMQKLSELTSLGQPLLLGTSRKSLIKHTLNLPAQERVEGTAATVALAIAAGADIIRVHDVKAMSRVARMTDAIVRRTEKE